MFFLLKPSEGVVREFLEAQKTQPFSYPHVSASREQNPPGYDVDHHRVQTGSGPADFERACKALREWKMFDIPWLTLCRPHAAMEPGSNLAILASHAGFWSLNACRIVYLIDEHGACERCGFAYGTLPEHGERGEERFSVEFHRNDDSVWYDIYAFSRPRLMALLGYPYARMLQRRFARDSMKAMKEAAGRSFDK